MLASAAQQLQESVKQVGTAGPFALAMLEVIESTAKLQEFDEMAASAQNNSATGEEAQTWREISLMTLQYCRQGLVERQNAAVKQVCELAEQGASLFHVPVPAKLPAEATQPDETKPPQNPPASPKATLVQPPPGLDAPQAPPGVWAARPPPGLKQPTADATESKSKVAPPPGFGSAKKPAQAAKDTKLPPWRRMSPQKAPAKEEESCWASPIAANLDAYSDCESD